MSIFNSQSLKAKLSKLDQVDKSNQLKLKKIQDVSNIKIDRDQYLKYKQILFNHPNPKTSKQQEQPVAKVTTQATQTQTNDEKENNNNLMNLSKPISLIETEPDLSKPIPLLETEPSERNSLPPAQPQSEYRKNVYEFPKQMAPRGTQESESEEVSCQTENDLMPENNGYSSTQRGYNAVHNNVIIMEEMNPNLSFSSCPRSDFKALPVNDSFGDYHHHQKNQFRGLDERVLGSGQKSDQKEKKTRLIEYGGESVEVSETDSEEAQKEREEKNKKLQEEYNMYKKTILYNKKKEIKEKLPTESEKSIREEEQDSVQLEYRLLMEQRKALESDISQLKKIQDEAARSLPKKTIEQKQISPRSPRFTLNQQQQQQSLSSSREFFEGMEERLSEIVKLNFDSGRKFGSGRKENRREEHNFSLNDEREDSEELEREENVKTRRMKEDGWKVSQEFWDTRRRFINDDMNGHDEEEEHEEISEDRFYAKDSENYRSNRNHQQGDEIERKSRIRDLIDQVGASIEEIRNKKGHVDMKRNQMEDEHSLSKRTLYMLGSGSKDLVPISEEVSEEM